MTLDMGNLLGATVGAGLTIYAMDRLLYPERARKEAKRMKKTKSKKLRSIL